MTRYSLLSDDDRKEMRRIHEAVGEVAAAASRAASGCESGFADARAWAAALRSRREWLARVSTESGAS